MNRPLLLRPGSFARIIAKEPRHRVYVPIFAGDPSANSGPQDDSACGQHSLDRNAYIIPLLIPDLLF